MREESIYRIGAAGRVEVLEPAPDKDLGLFYTDSLQCATFDIYARHRMERYELLLVGDDTALLADAPVNPTVSQALGFTFYGDALLVCLHAVGEDGDDSRLVDVSCIYSHMGNDMWGVDSVPQCHDKTPAERVEDLLSFF